MPMSIRVRNWDRWQSYRSDRGQPPWIKVHRRLAQDPNWVTLTDAQRGQLVAMWILAADRDGVLPSDRRLLARMCFMSEEPDLEVFARLGFLELDASVTPTRRQHDRPEEGKRQSRVEAEEGQSNAREARSLANGGGFNELYQSRPAGPLIQAEAAYYRVIESGDVDHETLLRRWPEYVRRQEAGGLNVPHLANWLKRGGWGDTTLDDEAGSDAWESA